MSIVPLFCVNPEYESYAQSIAERYLLPRVSVRPSAGHWLELDDDRLTLETTGQQGSVYADFVHGRAKFQRESHAHTHQALAKALGLKGKYSVCKVVDATAGLGRDAFVVASLGCQVIMLERSPIAAALLNDALRRAACHEETRQVAANMRLEHEDAIHWLQKQGCEVCPDVILIDPMYPHNNRRAAAKKEMATFQQVIGEDQDAAKLLAEAVRVAIGRVVVKRPRLGSPIVGPTPSAVLIGKSTRFDIYVTKALRPA